MSKRLKTSVLCNEKSSFLKIKIFGTQMILWQKIEKVPGWLVRLRVTKTDFLGVTAETFWIIDRSSSKDSRKKVVDSTRPSPDLIWRFFSDFLTPSDLKFDSQPKNFSTVQILKSRKSMVWWHARDSLSHVS